MKKSIALTSALLASLALSACGSSAAPSVEPAPQETTAAAPAAETTQPEEAEETAAATNNRVAEFGDKVTFENGVSVILAAKGFQEASASAAGAVDGQMAVFELEVTNDGDEELQATLLGYPTVKYGEKGEGAQTVIDSASDVGVDQLTTLLPGETQTATIAYAIPAKQADDVRAEIPNPDFIGKPAIYKGSIK